MPWTTLQHSKLIHCGPKKIAVLHKASLDQFWKVFQCGMHGQGLKHSRQASWYFFQDFEEELLSFSLATMQWFRSIGRAWSDSYTKGRQEQETKNENGEARIGATLWCTLPMNTELNHQRAHLCLQFTSSMQSNGVQDLRSWETSKLRRCQNRSHITLKYLKKISHHNRVLGEVGTWWSDTQHKTLRTQRTDAQEPSTELTTCNTARAHIQIQH